MWVVGEQWKYVSRIGKARALIDIEIKKVGVLERRKKKV